mmetsp:Transcript_27464/g.52296  ORF Transcript_27464/g.52296 Transcript_27464/m.52296 type:complete len:150 (-) Transcript_27464:280-729(-)
MHLENVVFKAPAQDRMLTTVSVREMALGIPGSNIPDKNTIPECIFDQHDATHPYVTDDDDFRLSSNDEDEKSCPATPPGGPVAQCSTLETVTVEAAPAPGPPPCSSKSTSQASRAWRVRKRLGGAHQYGNKKKPVLFNFEVVCPEGCMC